MISRKNEPRKVPDLYTFETKEFSCREGYPHAQKRAHWHSEIEINILTQGRLTYLWHDRLITMEDKTLTLFWAGMPHQVIQAEAGSHCYWMYIPLAWFLQWRLPDPFSKAVLNGKMVVQSIKEQFSAERATIKQWKDDLEQNLPELRSIVLLEVEARIRRLAFQFIPETSPSRRHRAPIPAGPSERLEAMVGLMAREYRNPLTLSDIAKAGGLHPNYACSLFSRLCGISLRTYLNRLRISHAQRLLATTNMKIVDIAMDAGFSSLSRFYAAFDATCHRAPGDYREALTVSMEPPHQNPTA